MIRWKMRGQRLSLRILATLALVVPAGCGGPADNLPRQALSGKVSFDGQPVVKGNIQFLPTRQDQAFGVGAMIEGGSYSILRSEGPVPGTYKVMINAPDPASEAPKAAGAEVEAPGAGATVIPKDLIPKKYNVKSTLTAEVKAGGPNQFDFDLKK